MRPIRGSRALHVLIIVLCATLPYLGSVRGELVSDDVHDIGEDPLIRALTPANLRTIFTSRAGPNYDPVKIVSFALDYPFFGVNPAGYHAENIAWHIANALLVYWLLLRLGESAGLAFGVAILWAVHPVHVESVAWICERKNVLSTFFFLLAFLVYLRFSARPRTTTYLLVLVLFVGALLTKVNTIVLPAVILAYELAERFRLRARDVLAIVPMLAIGGLLAWANLHDNPSHGAEYHGGSMAVTLRTSSTVVPRYLGLVVFPWRASSYHAVPLRGSWLEPAVLAGVLLVLGIAVATVWLVAHRRRGGFWLLWFGLTLAPMLNLVPFPALMADRYLYMPLIGLLVLAARGVRLIAARWPALAPTIPWVTAAAVAACAALTIIRVPVFHDELSLWADWAVRMPYITGDRPWAASPRLPETRVLQQAIARDPDSAVLHNNLGGLAFDAGRLDEALGEFTRARQLDPQDPAIALNLGRTYLLTGQPAAAARTLEDAVRLEPPSYYAHLNLGRAYMQLGDTARARPAIETASRIRPRFTDWAPASAQLQRLEGAAGATPPVGRRQ
jgi:hypothetical protein